MDWQYQTRPDNTAQAVNLASAVYQLCHSLDVATLSSANRADIEAAIKMLVGEIVYLNTRPIVTGTARSDR